MIPITANLSKLITLQKRAIRIVGKTHYKSHTNPLFAQFKCLKFHDLVNLKILLTVFQARHNKLPFNIQKLFVDHNQIHSFQTRSKAKSNYNMLHCRTKIKSKAISIYGVKLWNNLDKSVQNVNSYVRFKKKVKNMLLSCYSN